MCYPSGELNSQGAIFIYKDDGTEIKALQDAIAVDNSTTCSSHTINQNGNVETVILQNNIRIEHHTNKQDFLDALQTWNESVHDYDNTFLCIYAHMGLPGMCCVGNDTGQLVSWEEFANALPNRVKTLWLAGCSSNNCIGIWNANNNPVSGMLLATDISKYWRPLIECFADEISLKSITPYDKMPKKTIEKSFKLAIHTVYYECNNGRLAEATFNKTIWKAMLIKLNFLFRKTVVRK